ncbi:uracil-DNA glycosylase [Spiribacter sp. 2438]|uniref:uracil-DNA glycosylase n=1 Tax=Spiribacter sp. 2438 TaxID=2666185 RepID=UPI0012AFAC43|nr:uracil-DNA glycosylase [Spiribacter sp. 2438]QGM21264.1 uracil-DNA glycosylase [Spiribacter sp. 2438]
MTSLDPRRQRLLAAMGLTAWSEQAAPAPDRQASAGDWAALESRIAACQGCPLHLTRRRAVPGVGDRAAPLMVVGEAPGAEEDRRGEPFVGRAGQLLDAMLAAIGLDRQSGVFITNVIKSRPPDNRDPRPEEMAACRPWLEQQIAMIQPRVILAVGKVSAQALTGQTGTLGRLRGRWHAGPDTGVPVRVTYHPAYLLRRPAAKAQAWEDLLALKAALREAA